MKKKTARRVRHVVAHKVVHKYVHPLHREVKLDPTIAVTALLVGFAVLIAVAMSLK